MEKQSVVLRFPKTLLKKVDKYKEQKGLALAHKQFSTYCKWLLNSQNAKKKKAIHLPPKEVGVFLLILDKAQIFKDVKSNSLIENYLARGQDGYQTSINTAFLLHFWKV